MNFHQSDVFFKIAFKFFWFLVQTFYSSFRSASTIHGVVSRRHSRIVKTEEEFLSNLGPFSPRFMVLAWCHPLIIVFDCENSFHNHTKHFHELFLFLDHPKAIISEDFFVLSFSASFSNYSKVMSLRSSPYYSGASSKYPLISSRSLRSHVSKS